MDDTIEISGYLFKRRGGLGKWSVNNWQSRLFTISKDGMLCYFENESSEANYFSESRARGRMDLKAIPYEFSCDVPTEGSPTPFVMQISPANDGEKWKLCAPNKEEQAKWAVVFEKFAAEHISSRAVLNYGSDHEDDGARIKRSVPLHKAASFAGRTFISDNNNSATSPQITPRGVRSASPTPSAPTSPVHPASSAALTPSASASAAHKVNTQASRIGKPNKKRLKVATSKGFINSDTLETLSVVVILNICLRLAFHSFVYSISTYGWVLLANFVVIRTLNLRSDRVSDSEAKLETAKESLEDALATAAALSHSVSTTASGSAAASGAAVAGHALVVSDAKASDVGVASDAIVVSGDGRPIAGQTLVDSGLPPNQSPDHTWCKADYRLFHVRIGPDYNRYKKKAPSAPPIYEPFAVDVFCTKLRMDHAARRFVIPEHLKKVDTHHPHVPPVFVIQIQIPSEPPPSFFTSVEDGPGWAILMYFKITEDTLKQLENYATATPAVKLFAQWCEKSFDDAAWRGRFKVICSCTNLEEMGMPQAIVSYNAKPVLIRRTGTLFKGDGYIEKDIHVHKFNSLAKSSIHMITSRCGLMYMQIGFVIEGRENDELPETLFACVAVNKPQEANGEFLFEDDEA